MKKLSPLATAVKAARILKGWSVSDLGRISGVSEHTLKSWESGRTQSLVAANERLLREALTAEGVEIVEGERLAVSVPYPVPDLLEAAK